MIKKIFLYVLLVLIFSGCKKLFEPDPQNFKTVEQMYDDATYAQGFLINGYRSIPGYYSNIEYATDDAVTNQKDNSYLKMATGTWTSINNPVNLWQSAYGAIQYMNLFLQNADSVHWANDDEAAALFNVRMKGEAYGLRALHLYFLLRNHAGFGNNSGKLLGVPILTEFQTVNSDFNLSRATFQECVDQIYADLDKAKENLPMEYNDVSSPNEIPTRFRTITENSDTYNRVMGHFSRQLFNGLIADAFRAKTALLAASPAFQDPENKTTWADAADAAAMVIDYNGGVSGLSPTGVTYYANSAEIDGLGEGINPKEIIWRENLATNNSDQENQNFPPSIFGNGFMNPTQNLVDAFPMANGYPIKDSRSGYNSNSPFTNRDPRLGKYIIYNGSQAGVSNSVIITGSLSGTDDGINVRETSTRTGYYMRKRLRMDVNMNPSATSGKTHYNPRIRYTEIYLSYAEAANEAWGPTGSGSHSYSAYDVVKAIRQRAGIGGSADAYLEECKANKDKMRELIHNERRIELSFEGFRFWDLRRWKDDLNETALGMDINGGNIEIINVENRSFKDYMYYGPIPNSEILKFSNLEQNRDW